MHQHDFQLNHLPSFFHKIPDEVFRKATSSRRKLVAEQSEYSVEQQAIRIINHMDKENEFMKLDLAFITQAHKGFLNQQK